MALLRQSRFVILCVAVALIAYEIGGGGILARIFGPAWFPNLLLRLTIPAAETVHRTAIAPLTPVRLTQAEITERDRRLTAAFGAAIPAANNLWDSGVLSVTLRNLTLCLKQRPGTALTANNNCDILNTNVFANFILAQIDPKIETAFSRRTKDGHAALFFLGNDGKAKIALLLSNQYINGQYIGPDKWMTVPLRDGTRTLLKYSGVSTIWFGDDPGPDTDDRALLIMLVSRKESERSLDIVQTDADLKARFKYYAALKNKSYDPKEWRNKCFRSAYYGCVPPF